MHAAWRKRAEEAEAEVVLLKKKLDEAKELGRLEGMLESALLAKKCFNEFEANLYAIRARAQEILRCGTCKFWLKVNMQCAKRLSKSPLLCAADDEACGCHEAQEVAK